jgi:hypothetical protein
LVFEVLEQRDITTRITGRDAIPVKLTVLAAEGLLESAAR